MKVVVTKSFKSPFKAIYNGYLYVTILKNIMINSVNFGRSVKDFPDTWIDDYHMWKSGKVTAVSLYKKYGMGRSTFYRKVHEFETNKSPAVSKKIVGYELWVYVYKNNSYSIPKTPPVKTIKCGKRKGSEGFYYDECVNSIIYAIHEMNELPIPDIDYGFCEFVWDSSNINGYN